MSKGFLDNLGDKNVNSEPFREMCKPYFTSKHSKDDTNIVLIEKG